jgi:uncharacterized protein
MKQVLLAVLLCLGSCAISLAQQTQAEAPASKEDIQRFFDVMHSKEMMAKMVDAMNKPMHQLIHEQYLKDKDKLPPDFETRMNKTMNDIMKTFPWPEMLDAMVPVYRKHLAKSDVDALVAFYSTPTGQKLLRELPEIGAEAMQSAMPLLRKNIEAMNQRVQQEVAAMVKDSGSKSETAAPQKNN